VLGYALYCALTCLFLSLSGDDLVRRTKLAAEIRLEVPGFGALVWYARGEFYAYYLDPTGVVSFRKSRTSKAGKRPAQGRPLGFLYHWLTVLAPESSEHPPDRGIQPDREERIVARLALADIPGSEALFDKEAPVQNPEDGEEPDECP
jgi:hypothetical protein